MIINPEKKKVTLEFLKDLQKAVRKFDNLRSDYRLRASGELKNILRRQNEESILIRLGTTCPYNWDLRTIKNNLIKLNYTKYQVKWLLSLFKEIKAVRSNKRCAMNKYGLSSCKICKYHSFCNNLARCCPESWNFRNINYAFKRIGWF